VAEAPSASLEGTATLASTSIAVLVLDDERHCTEANLAACRLLGRSREEVVGKALDELLAPGMGERLEAVWRAFLEGGGHAGPFDLPAGGGPVDVALTANLLPGRHLLLLAPSGELPAAVEANGARLAASAGARLPTRREREILGMLAQGATDGQIATTLEVSPATVQTHVRNVKAKLGARTRAQAVALALDRGVIDLS
jgi:PAS domain S-box-containing protein